MPPPSPPHSYGARSQSTNAPASSLLSRDAPSAPSHRPGSSMSISAMLGSDSERPARDIGSSLFSRPPGSSIFGNAPLSASAAMSPPTGPSRPSPLDQSAFRRSHTPRSRSQGRRLAGHTGLGLVVGQVYLEVSSRLNSAACHAHHSLNTPKSRIPQIRPLRSPLLNRPTMSPVA